jgi:hypothetical protein
MLFTHICVRRIREIGQRLRSAKPRRKHQLLHGQARRVGEEVYDNYSITGARNTSAVVAAVSAANQTATDASPRRPPFFAANDVGPRLLQHPRQRGDHREDRPCGYARDQQETDDLGSEFAARFAAEEFAAQLTEPAQCGGVGRSVWKRLAAAAHFRVRLEVVIR